jgi:hypothetical protein
MVKYLIYKVLKTEALWGGGGVEARFQMALFMSGIRELGSYVPLRKSLATVPFPADGLLPITDEITLVRFLKVHTSSSFSDLL